MAALRKFGWLVKETYNAGDLARIETLFRDMNTLSITPSADGLFAASSSVNRQSATGYQDVWIRDNVMVASSFLLRGDAETASRTSQGVTRLLQSQEARFRGIIQDPARKENVQERPHVRFRVDPEEQKSKNWAHAQNDALGYALWLRFRLANSGKLDLSDDEEKFYRLFPLYFKAIEYWNDADSGAWEEDRKVNSSSIGAVVAGLREMLVWLQSKRPANPAGSEDLVRVVEESISQGKAQLQRFLPSESPPRRRADAALLFLIHPAEVVDLQQEDSILSLVSSELMREIGIIRYVDDSYYGQDYPDWFAENELTADFSERIEVRNQKFKKGYEAQWCIFDPLLSVIYGKRFLADPGDMRNHELQTSFFKRSLGQLTEELKCPELYFFRHGRWIDNPHTPLAWTQANLSLALHFMKRSAQVTL